MSYRCVNCGNPAAALYKTYGPSVVKLIKCVHCKGIVDKYVEYDPVIVMIDLVLNSKEAQRHMLYNTPFKFYWKLLILVLLLETFSVWKGDSLLSVLVHSLCHTHTNHTHHVYLEFPWQMSQWPAVDAACVQWSPRPPLAAPSQPPHPHFIWEKQFYVHFLGTAVGFAVFVMAVHGTMAVVSTIARRPQVEWTLALKSLTVGGLFSLGVGGALVWGQTEPAPTRALHHALGTLCTVGAHATLTHVVYDLAWWWSIALLVVSWGLRLTAVFIVTAYCTALLHTADHW